MPLPGGSGRAQYQRGLRVHSTWITLLQGDITQQAADVIVNAANSSLAGGGGVDGAIHRAGGPEIMKELNEIKKVQSGCATGSAVITSAGNLNARHVVHAVGPRYRNGQDGEPELLASAYESSLRLAVQAGARTVALPSISTGVYSYPVEPAARIALGTVAAFCRVFDQLERITFVLFDSVTFKAYEKAFVEFNREPDL
jgi:O-acetyl-ADP-ribose deacetylase (regulator of RNase III)